MKKQIYIGIDGGGTHSTAAAVYADGRVAAVTQGGGLNFLSDGIPAVKQRLDEMILALMARCPGAELIKVCAGMAALDAEANEETHRRFAGGPVARRQLDLQSDAYIALMGITRGGPGMIVICGTGSMLLRRDGAGELTAAGGWGYLLGDAGSGYALARDGLNAVIAAEEGLGPPTALTASARGYFGVENLRGLIDRIYHPAFTPKDMAGYGRYVLEAAAGNDAAAQEIVQKNMRLLARQAAQLSAEKAEVTSVGLYGGVFRHSALALDEFRGTLRSLAPRLTVSFPELPPELGAVIHLMEKDGCRTEEALNTMKTTYKEFLS